MKRSYRKLLVIAFIIFVFSITGCATLGPVYQKVDKIPDNSGLVYIYRSPGFVGGGVAPNLYTDKGKTSLVKIYPGGYFPRILQNREKLISQLQPKRKAQSHSMLNPARSIT